MEKELYRSKDDDSDEDEKPKKKLPFGVSTPKVTDAEPKAPARPNHHVLGEGIIELHQDEPPETEGHVYKSARLFLHDIEKEEPAEDLTEEEDDEEEAVPASSKTDSQPEPDSVPESEPILSTEADELTPEGIPDEEEMTVADLPPIVEREQAEAEEDVPAAQVVGQTVSHNQVPPLEELPNQPPILGSPQFEYLHGDMPPYARDAMQQPTPDSRFAYAPKQTAEREYVSEGDPRVGPLAFLLGMEYFARKRAIRKLEKKTEKRMNEKLAQYPLVSPAEHQPYDAYTPVKTGAELPAVERERIATEVADEALERINLQGNQHVEQSAWHSFAVDEYGHIVNDAINYGEGFQREQQQEVRRRDQLQKAPAIAPIFIPHVPAMANPPANSSQQGSLPSGMTTPTLLEGEPVQADAQHRLVGPKKQDINQVWHWLLLLLILAAILTALFS